ncbi:MAG: GNAT family N-acetyltransferase [Flavobacteriales bacterium]
MASIFNSTIELKGEKVKLIPLKIEHANNLLEASDDGNLSKLWFTSVPDKTNINTYIKTALNEFKNGKSIPFTVVETTSGRIIGSTRFMNIDSKNKRLEIGHTWYSKSHQKTGINIESKLLLLTYAFEELNCIAVEFRTHWHNLPSRNAIAKLGAKQDGILRNHSYDKMGNLRDTVVFSIIKSEWQTVKYNLIYRLDNR